MAAGASGGTTINRVRLLRGGRDALAARLTVERILAGAAHAPGLPPAAILCVKRLRAPLPGSIRLAPSHGAPRRWTQSVHEAMAALARRAARPARDPIAGDPDAVIFDDRAQMLACLAADWSSGTAGARWWWRALLGGGTDIRTVLREWLVCPEHIAAAVEELAHLAGAARFIRCLSAEDTRLLMQAIVATHDLPQVADAIAPPTARAVPEHAAAGPPEVRTTAGTERALQSDVPRAPWADTAPEACEPQLRPEHELLLGVALTVRRRPVMARSAAFAAATHAWREATAHAAHRDTGSAAPRRVPSPEPTAVAPASTLRVTPPAMPLSAADARVSTAADRAPSHLTEVTSASSRDLPAPRAVAARAARRPLDVHTELGGLFYLLNAAIALGYYGDFTAPSYRNLDVSIWDFVALVGRALVRNDDDDPVWALLAALAGRDVGEAPDRRAVRRVRRLVPTVRARLAAAVGARRRAALVTLVFRHHARVLSTATHLDIVFSLAELPLAIRMSGLDRDPGWIPAADRIVTFHFE